MSSPLHLLHLCSPTSAHSHSHVSWVAPCWTTSGWSLKHQFPKKSLCQVQNHLPMCFSMQGCVNSELCVTSVFDGHWPLRLLSFVVQLLLYCLTTQLMFSSQLMLLYPLPSLWSWVNLVCYVSRLFLTMWSHIAWNTTQAKAEEQVLL